MKKLLYAAAFIVLLVPGILPAQERWEDTPRPGIAVEDRSSASLVNLASLGVGNSTGLGWSGYLNGSGNIDQTFHSALGSFAYNYRNFNGQANHEFALGFPLYQGLYFGTGLRWDKGDELGINTHMLYRPWTWMSLGMKGESLNNSPWMDWGAGLRPLVFSPYWGSRFTLFYDGRVTSRGGYTNLSTGFRMEPVDGLEIYGHWDFLDEKFVTGLNLSLNRLMLGGDVTVSGDRQWNEGSIQTFVSLREMRSISARRKRLVIYDVAQIITDTPRPYARARSWGPDPTPTRSIYEFLMDIEALINYPEVESVLFDSQAFATSFSNLIEIEQALKRLKEAGKKIYFYADRIGSRQYALAASVADGIIMSPQGTLDLTGFGVTNLYLKDLMARYGINVVNFRSHEYKTAYDQFSEAEMSEAQRESLETVYGALQDEMDRMILGGRKDRISGNLDALYASGYWMSAAEAAEAGLIDQVLYRDQLETWLEMEKYRAVRFSRFRWQMEYDWLTTNRPNVALIYAEGNITAGTGSRGRSIGADSLAAAIRSARENPMISAIVLRVDSGGGSALASDIIAREVALCATGDRIKPVVISMGGMAASGAYMIAAPGKRILATPGTVTGSIGVIALIPDISGLLESFEIGVDTVTTTESADVPNIFRPLTEIEEQRIRDSVMRNYDSFVDLVALNRDMSPEEVDRIARGQIWTGKQAMERGLVDDMGGLSDAIDLAEDMAGIRNARVLEINPGTVGFSLPGMAASLAALFGLEEPDPLEMLPEDLSKVLELYRTVSEYERGEALFLSPYTAEDLGVE